jgi:hypothetical protein
MLTVFWYFIGIKFVTASGYIDKGNYDVVAPKCSIVAAYPV